MKMLLYRHDTMGRIAVAVEENELYFAVRDSDDNISLHPLREVIVAEMNRVADSLQSRPGPCSSAAERPPNGRRSAVQIRPGSRPSRG